MRIDIDAYRKLEGKLIGQAKQIADLTKQLDKQIEVLTEIVADAEGFIERTVGTILWLERAKAALQEETE